VSGDTTAVGAEARAVESGMNGWLGRVKERAPGCKLPSGKYRKSELTIFRVLQESLTNVHRHSGSKSVQITMRIQGADVYLEVRDHGSGMKVDVLKKFQETGSQVGVGLAGMRQRLNELGGRFETDSDKNGTAIKVVIPRGP